MSQILGQKHPAAAAWAQSPILLQRYVSVLRVSIFYQHAHFVNLWTMYQCKDFEDLNFIEKNFEKIPSQYPNQNLISVS